MKKKLKKAKPTKAKSIVARKKKARRENEEILEREVKVKRISFTQKPKYFHKPTIVVLAFDVSPQRIAGAACAYDDVLDQIVGPAWDMVRWSNKDNWYEILATLARGHDFVHELIRQLKLTPELDEIYIGVEESYPFGMQKMSSLRQQAEVNGAFKGGLLRYGYKHIREINPKKWQAFVARDMDMKASKKDGFDKWTVKEWAREVYPDMPDWPDMITSTNGLIPKPETSKAKAKQPDDRYDCTGMMDWLFDAVQKEQVK